MSVEYQSLMDTVGTEPWDYYARVHELGDVFWDARLNAWVITSYDVCKHILRNDKKLVHHPAEDTPHDDPYAEIQGPAEITHLTGELHRRVHAWWVQQFATRQVAEWRGRFIEPILESTLSRFETRGTADLAAELTHPIPVRVIAAIFGLPYEDDAWIARCKELLGRKLAFLEAVRATQGGPTPASAEEQQRATERCVAAARELNGILLPYIEARRDDPQDDLMSKLWVEGASVWGKVDNDIMCSAVATLFFAGTDTTTHVMQNGLHMLLTDDALMRQFREADEATTVRITEEMLRLQGSVHFRPRIANVDIEVGDTTIRAGDMIIMSNQAANRDPRHYGCPAAVDVGRERAQDHMAFNFGPRFCAGAPLARAELQTVLRVAVDRLPGLRTDPDGESPRLEGFLMRSYAPLHVRFDV